jgi:hypothetical protein
MFLVHGSYNSEEHGWRIRSSQKGFVKRALELIDETDSSVSEDWKMLS